MKIDRITLFFNNKLNFGSHPNKEDKKSKNIKSDSLEQAYQDYKVGNARLFRTPEDFYSQPFNKNGMPLSMKNYLYSDFETNQHIPPMQLMQVVFDKLNYAKSLDDVKRSQYPDEPLFKNLSSTPRVNTAVVADIQYVKKDNPKLPIFKDGQDDLGLYLLKKIYLEGKMLKEIDADFQKDINDEYQGIAPIKDETIYAFGIRRPQAGFWKSLVHNRDNFPYVYIPRKHVDITSEREKIAPRSVVSTVKDNSLPAKQRRKLSDEQKRAMSEYMLDFWKDITPEERERRKKKIKAGQENSFLFQYTSPIMTLAAAQVNLSDRLSEYLSNARLPENLNQILKDAKDVDTQINFDNPNNTQKAIMKAFWKENPDIKGEFGAAIRSILDEFQQAYGVDGENDEFRILVQIADDIKSENAQRLANRRQRKADVEYAFKNYPNNIDVETESTAQVRQVADKLKQFERENELLDQALKENDAQSYVIETEEGKYNIVANFKQEFKKSIANSLRHYPKSYVDAYSRFLDKTALISDEFIVSSLLESNNQIELADKVMAREDRDKVSDLLNREFVLRNENLERAATQVVTDFLAACRPEGQRAKVYFAAPLDLLNALNNDTMESGEYYTPQNVKLMNDSYELYKKTLTSSEINKITNTLISYIRNLNPDTLVMKNGEKAVLLEAMSINIKNNDKYKEILLKVMRNDGFIQNSGGSLRMLLSNSKTQEERNAKAEKVIYSLLDFDPRVTYYLATSNLDTFENFIKFKSPELYYKLKQ